MRNKLSSLLFLAILFSVTITSLAVPDRVYSEQEKRNLTQWEDITGDNFSIRTLSDDLEKYLTDQMPGRDRMVTAKTLVDIAIGQKQINGVYIGKDHYLLDVFDSYDKKEFEKNLKKLKKLQKKLNKKNIANQVILVPSAEEILDTRLPDYAQNGLQESLLDKAGKKLENVVDIREALKEHKGEYIYYRTDHHWTSIGAYYAYVQWKKALGQDAAPLSAWKREVLSRDFQGTTWNKVGIPGKEYQDTITAFYHNKNREVVYNDGAYVNNCIYEKSYLEGKDKYGVFFNSNQIITKIEGGAKSGKLLIVKDSYANTFAQFAIDDYAEVQMIDMRFYRGDLYSYIKDNDFTDVLFLYGCSGFATEEKRF